MASQSNAQQTASEITISGIAWQDERSLRRAVLNGALVGEEAEVARARVVEIPEDKVRLTRGRAGFRSPTFFELLDSLSG